MKTGYKYSLIITGVIVFIFLVIFFQIKKSKKVEYEENRVSEIQKFESKMENVFDTINSNNSNYEKILELENEYKKELNMRNELRIYRQMLDDQLLVEMAIKSLIKAKETYEKKYGVNKYHLHYIDDEIKLDWWSILENEGYPKTSVEKEKLSAVIAKYKESMMSMIVLWGGGPIGKENIKTYYEDLDNVRTIINEAKMTYFWKWVNANNYETIKSNNEDRIKDIEKEINKYKNINESLDTRILSDLELLKIEYTSLNDRYQYQNIDFENLLSMKNMI